MSDPTDHETNTPAPRTSSRASQPRQQEPLGAGSEAAEGIRGAQLGGDAPLERTALGDVETGAATRDGAERAGSEPLRDRTEIHVSAYGGAGGAPRAPAELDTKHVSPPKGAG